MDPRTETNTAAGPGVAPATAEAEARADAPSGVRRSDRWSSEPPERRANGWVLLGSLLVVGGYGLAIVVVSAARGSIDVSDELAKGLVATAPALAALGAAIGFIGTRRSSLRGLAWVVVAVGLVLVLATIAAIAWLLLVLRSFE